MEFKIPFTFSSIEILKKRTKFLINQGRYLSRANKALPKYLKDANIDLNKEDYTSICLYTFILAFVILSTIFTSVLGVLNSNVYPVPQFYFIGAGLAFIFSIFVFFAQYNYPKSFAFKEGRLLDKNLLPALQDIQVQLNSGVPLFDIMNNIGNSNYGEVSLKFKRIVREINSGKPQIQAIESVGKRTSSVFFRRTLWQISNGMRAGSEMETIIKESIASLNEEKLLQIPSYGNKLNPLVVFYMLLAVILPALSITFLTIITSMLGLDKSMSTLLYLTLFVMVVLMQIMFLGIIKSRRPSLI